MNMLLFIVFFALMIAGVPLGVSMETPNKYRKW